MTVNKNAKALIESLYIGSNKAKISGTNVTVGVTRAEIEQKIAPTKLEFSTNAKIYPAITELQDFKKTVKYKIRSEDKKTITEFKVNAVIKDSVIIDEVAVTRGKATIDHDDKTIDWVPFFDFAKLKLEDLSFVTKGQVAEKDFNDKDFSDGKVYRISSYDRSVTQDYTVNVREPLNLAAIVAAKVKVNGKDVDITVDNDAKTLTADVPSNTDFENFEPKLFFFLNETSDIATAKLDTELGKEVDTLTGKFNVTAEDKKTKFEYSMKFLNKAKSNAREITGFKVKVGDKEYAAKIGKREKNVFDNITAAEIITLTLPEGTDVSKIAPVITLANDTKKKVKNDKGEEVLPAPKATVSPASKAEVDFKESKKTPVKYTVTAEDGSTRVYEVTITAPAKK